MAERSRDVFFTSILKMLKIAFYLGHIGASSLEHWNASLTEN